MSVRELTKGEQVSLLNIVSGDDFVKCPFCGGHLKEEDLEQHIGVAHVKEKNDG